MKLEPGWIAWVLSLVVLGGACGAAGGGLEDRDGAVAIDERDDAQTPRSSEAGGARPMDAGPAAGGGDAARDAAAGTPADAAPSTRDLGAGDVVARDGARTDTASTGVGTIGCGATVCSLQAAYCCATAAGATCRARNVACTAGAARRCDGPEDCATNQVCCAHVDPAAPGVYRSECSERLACVPAVLLCRRNDQCPTGQLCCPTTSAGVTFSSCRERC